MNYVRSIFRGSSRSLLAGSFVIALLLSMTLPVRAVVFTNPASITINDPTAIGPGTPYPSNISVSGMAGTVSTVTVTLSNLNHTFIPDVDILLVGPTGQNLILMSDVSSANDIFNTTVTFDDAAPTTVPVAGTLPPGSYKPTNVGGADVFPAPAPAASANTTLAAAFGGTNPNGTWNLYLVDDVAADMGTMGNGWSLTITTTMTGATTFTNGGAIFDNDAGKGKASLYPSPITVSGLVGAITDINVTMTNINHSFPDDVDVMLVGPSGKRLILMSDVGGDPDLVGVNITIDDQAAAALPDATAIATGSFRPTNIGAAEFFPELLPKYSNPATGGTATLATVFNGTEPNGVWKLYVLDAFTPDAGNIMGGWSIDITAGGNYGAKRFTSADFDGDGKTDTAVRRSSTNEWFGRESNAFSNRATVGFGLSSDIAVPGDYDGDQKTDLAVWRPSTGVWSVLRSSDSVLAQTPFGLATDKPVPADYDGDGKVDIAVFRGAAPAVWYILRSSNNTVRAVTWGTVGDIPVRGYFEGTSGADFTVFRPTEGNWYIQNNAETSSRVVNLGTSSDVLVPADYDADGKTDAAVWRDGTGDFYVLNSTTSSVRGTHWGQSGDTPIPGDFDGDSRIDYAVWRSSTGTWYILNSGTPAGSAAITFDNWGQLGDTPLGAL